MNPTASDYRYEVRDAAFRLLADCQYEALLALQGAFLDRASEAFDARDDARRRGETDLAEYWTLVRKTASELADHCDAAARLIPDASPHESKVENGWTEERWNEPPPATDPLEQRNIAEAHAEGFHADSPREFCPECGEQYRRTLAATESRRADVLERNERARRGLFGDLSS